MEHAIARPHVSRSRPRGAGPLGRLLALMALSRSRRRLSDLDDHMLRDVGLSPDQARQEAARRAWNAPAHWVR